MNLSVSETARVTRWTGPLKETDVPTVETLIEELGEPEAAALQILQMKRAQLALAPASVGSGTDRVDHSKNLPAIDDLISDLVDFINGCLDDLELTEQGEMLVKAATAATGPDGQDMIQVQTTAHAPRRG